MEIPVLKVEKREYVGKGSTIELRKQGRIPGVCYGHNKPTFNISLNTEELTNILRSPLGLNSLIQLDGAEDRTVFVQELQRDPVKRNIVHVDFLLIDTSKSVQRHVPVEFTGKPEGAKTGGVLQVTARDIMIEALPAQIPHHVTINVEPLHIGQSIHIKEVPFPEGVKAVYEQNYSICAVVSPTEEATAEAEPTEAPQPTETAKETAAKPGESQDSSAQKKPEEKPGSDKK